MVDIPRLQLLDLLDDEDGEEQHAHSLGIRTLRKSGGSVVVTVPPDVMDLVEMELGDDVVVHASAEAITLTKLPDQD